MPAKSSIHLLSDLLPVLIEGRKILLLEVLVQLPLAHLGTPPWLGHVREVGVDGKGISQRLRDENLTWCVWQMLYGTHHMGNSEVVVIDNAGQMVQTCSIGTLDDVVLFLSPIECHIPTNHIMKRALAFAGHLQSDCRNSPLRLQLSCMRLISGHPFSIVEKRFPFFLCRLPLLLQLLGSRVVAIGMPRFQQPFHFRLIPFHPLRLVVGRVRSTHVRTLIPVQPQPSESLKNRLQSFLDIALLVGIIDAQQECAISLSGEQIIEQRRADSTNVQIARGTGGKTRPDRHRLSL